MVRGTIAQFGLKGALEDLASTIQTPGKLQVELSLFGLEERLKPEIEIAVYRMVQEMVSNILKHAKATQLTVEVTRAAGELNVMVEDNGVGFEPGKVEEGMGMGNLRARAAEIKGRIQIDTRPGYGPPSPSIFHLTDGQELPPSTALRGAAPLITQRRVFFPELGLAIFDVTHT
jgi:signal transduction histidine kinase